MAKGWTGFSKDRVHSAVLLGKATSEEIGEYLGLTSRAVTNHLKILMEEGRITRIGVRRRGFKYVPNNKYIIKE